MSAYRSRAFVCMLLSSAVPAAADPPAGGVPPTPQIVIISFDGAHDLAQWRRSRALAARTGAHFTYFLSCVFLLSPQTRRSYDPPGKSPGRSNVGFAQSTGEVAARLGQIWQARAEGHDIASHGCGHFDGGGWSKANWLDEFSSFQTILRDAYAINGIAGEPAGWKQFAQTEIVGFRAPYLSTSKNLYGALAAGHFKYDASGISRGPVEPVAAGGVVRFSLPQIPEGPAGRRVIAMDYNLFVRHSGGFERQDKNAVFEDRAHDAFHAAFDKEYGGGRVPLQIGFHFTLMNGGAYWRALERFAGEVCVKPDVACISYGDFLKRKDSSTALRASKAGG